MANPRLPNITESEQELLYEKLNIYNQGKPLIRRWDVTLWFYRGRASELQPVVLHASARQAVHPLYRRPETGHYPVVAHRHFRIVVCQPPHPDHGLQRKEDVDTRGRPDRFRQIPRTFPV